MQTLTISSYQNSSPQRDSLKTRQQSQKSKQYLKSEYFLKSQKYHKTDNVQQLTHKQILQKNSLRKNNKKVYLLYTSGCVGANQKLTIHEGFLKEKIIMNSYLCDYKQTMKKQGHQRNQTQNKKENKNKIKNILVSPKLQNGCRVQYIIQQMPLIQASINCSIEDVIKIALKIKQNYQKFDAFIILTGFDLMTYISTLLSFMLQNLSKCVIFTGGNFPISFVRNDFINNLIQSFSIISLNKGLNDVIIICKNKGYRANRSIKVKESQLDMIKSPNLHSLVSIDIKIRFKVNLFLPIPTEPFNVFTDISQKIHILKFHIFMNKQTLIYQLKNPNIIGYLIESYTGANLPQDVQLLQIFKQASQNQGKIFVNISQNIHKEKKSLMKEHLQKYHIYFGGDMTAQAALAKLSYLIGKRFSKEQIIAKISTNLRGQLTQTKNQNQFQIQTEGLMEVIDDVLEDFYPTSTQKIFTKILQDQIGKYISTETTPQQFKIIYKNCKKPHQAQISSLTQLINRNNLLHYAVIHQNIPLISYFLSLQIDLDRLDKYKSSAFFYALKSHNKSIIQLLYKKNCHIICPIDDLLQILIREIKKDNFDFFQLLYHIEFKTSLSQIYNNQKRNVAHLAALLGAEKCLKIFLSKFKFQFNQKDIYGITIQEYISIYKKNQQLKQKLTNDDE